METEKETTDCNLIIQSDRTFAIYTLVQPENALPELTLQYYHSSKALDNITRVRLLDAQATILFAHNFVEMFALGTQESKRVFCKEEECLLYSGDIDVRRGLVAAGTVFRVLLVWNSATGDILHKLKGHTGVIFDAYFLRAKTGGIFVGSVSDDRSVRVWKDDSQVAILFGHSSRIWKLAQIEGDTTEGQIAIASVSEDATCRVWKVNTSGVGDESRELVNLRGHLGKNVRGVSALGDFLATGGEDGGVKVWNLAKLLQSNQIKD